MNRLREYIKTKLTILVNDRAAKNIEPQGVPMPDLQRSISDDVKAILNDLWQAGELDYHKTINNIALKLREK